MRTATKSIFVLLMIMSCSVFAANNSKPASPPCATKESCLTDPNCFCWCSQMCGWRQKEDADHPVYIDNDQYGKHCYCKQWDYDHYEDNCINGKNVKQPKGAR